ncbi:unnamed protein product [Clonostachys rosea f. rosea IK726]|uniref:Uncharacterized protein n=1 Tax=Clonostachys rosea f. rosea IK726 TaxID=1349383 RepID=A0ACA9TS59_BIOOC|nr:unnamed protein product [Clonostachys rosea f. rosea IK726]
MALSLSTQRHLVRIEVHADTLCPWSYLVKKSLDKAIQGFIRRYPSVEFEVLWRPFYLYPRLTRGTNKLSLYHKEVDSHLLTDMIQAAGLKHGVHFRLDGTTGPSRSSHKLIALALQQRGPQIQSEVVERLFRGYFEEGEDISDEDWLVQVGKGCGLAANDVLVALRSKAASFSIDEEARGAGAEREVKAVPSVTIQGRVRIFGYQGVEVFDDAFEKLRLSDYA